MNLDTTVRSKPETVDPAWQAWLDLIELAVQESQQPAWSDTVRVRPSPEPDAPRLHLAAVRVDREHAARFVRRLTGEVGLVAIGEIDPLAFILAGIEREPETLDALARRLAVSTDSVATLAQLSAMPVLLNVSQQLDPEAGRTWQRGYCPVCGAWPALAEMRGIQRERRLRCGCCGSDWTFPVLRCVFCDELHHQKLGSLLDDTGAQHVRVETCTTCRGYLKSITALGALPFPQLARIDLATLAFDLAAQDRGYARPARPAWPVSIEIVS